MMTYVLHLYFFLHAESLTWLMGYLSKPLRQICDVVLYKNIDSNGTEPQLIMVVSCTCACQLQKYCIYALLILGREMGENEYCLGTRNSLGNIKENIVSATSFKSGVFRSFVLNVNPVFRPHTSRLHLLHTSLCTYSQFNLWLLPSLIFSWACLSVLNTFTPVSDIVLWLKKKSLGTYSMRACLLEERVWRTTLLASHQTALLLHFSPKLLKKSPCAVS